jgi:hypothetical protein
MPIAKTLTNFNTAFQFSSPELAAKQQTYYDDTILIQNRGNNPTTILTRA